MTKRLFRFAARGYTIVEISIVLVVAGLLLSGAIASFDRWARYEQARTTRDTIDLVKEAIVQYAARNRTAPRPIRLAETGWNMPPSRPYLPCPDIDGDGIEDRVENADLLALTVHIRGVGSHENNANRNLFYGHGLCRSQRGLLPWRTLRVLAADAWGGLFSYYVDSGFSHSLVGFNQDDHADQLDTRRPLDDFDDRFSQYRERVESIDTTSGNQPKADQLPALVCDFGPCSPDRKKNDALTLSSSGGAGAVATEVEDRFSRGIVGSARVPILRRLEENMIYEAPAFVVISHGANGYGAVAVANTQIGINTRARYTKVAGRYSFRCASFPDGNIATAAYLAERQNAWRSQALGGENLGAVCPQVNVEDDSGEYVYRRNYTARADPDAAEFDDVVGWMEVDVLKARLSEIGALPAPGLPPFGIRIQ